MRDMDKREAIRAILTGVPNDLSYDNWILAGIAIYNETDGEGFDLWDEWSRASPKYTSREFTLAKWRSFDTLDIDIKISILMLAELTRWYRGA